MVGELPVHASAFSLSPIQHELDLCLGLVLCEGWVTLNFSICLDLLELVLYVLPHLEWVRFKADYTPREPEVTYFYVTILVDEDI